MIASLLSKTKKLNFSFFLQSIKVPETLNGTIFSQLYFDQHVCIRLESAHINRSCKDASRSIIIKGT